MANKIIQLKDGADNVYGTTTPFKTSSESFSVLVENTFIRTALEEIHSNISILQSGFNQVFGGGPNYGVFLYKLNENYYGGLLVGYRGNEEPFVKFSYNNGLFCVAIF